ncbi:5',5'''-P-1,P-4-tetraphosphate phosphorylase 2 [Termitomyces sp. T112]|nr:5',5'''-P-1,P-4-tetraphosphate phosphorylase 2 [Termitomyces sp. T112]
MSPAEIISSISNKFIEARECGELLFFPSTICKHEDLGVQFEVRLCPALQKKPVAEVDLAKEKIKEGTQFDAFTPPYNPSLHVGDLEDDGGTNYVVLLNKFALLPDHFLLVTKEFQSQTSPLMPPDLVQTYFLLAEARKLGKQYFAFYNCGEHSGASQPRKHIQFIPVHDKNPPIEVLAKAANLEVQDKPFSLTALPYAHYVFRFPNQLPSYTQDKIEQVLSSAFLSLLDLVVSTVRLDPEYPPGRPSYNVLITLEHMHLIPRKQDVYTIPETGYKVSVNALGFAGMLLVKSNEELKALEKESVGTVLLSLGLKNVHNTQIGDITAEVE